MPGVAVSVARDRHQPQRHGEGIDQDQRHRKARQRGAEQGQHPAGFVEQRTAVHGRDRPNRDTQYQGQEQGGSGEQRRRGNAPCQLRQYRHAVNIRQSQVPTDHFTEPAGVTQADAA